jgi:hypothetical protein
MMYRDFWEAGYRIFPLYRFKVGGQCECGESDCEAAGKHPRTSNWQHTPAWHEDNIADGEELGVYDTGYGVLCRGLLVVDVDARNGGVKSYGKLLEKVPEIAGAGLAVQTGSGGGSQHLYFRIPGTLSLVAHLKAYPGIDFKSSGYVVGPGSAHVSGGIYSADGTPDDIGDAPEGLLQLLRQPERRRTEYDGHSIDVSLSDIGEMLSYIPNNDLDYESWIAIGMAVHHATGGAGYEYWEGWSEQSHKHDQSNMERKWHSFGKSANPVTIGTLIHYARQGGWIMPVALAGEDDTPAPVKEIPGGLPCDISGIDLTRPPGFVGEVAEWIDSQSFRPRKHLAVAAALTSIGNIGGLRYVDDISSVTANLFCFCVAGSRTGKEGIQQAAITLLRTAGISGAAHGSIKSEQEVTRNLTRHQASFYIVDEVGLFLAKISNAQKRGGASYLEGVPMILMLAYSKANDYMLLTGDGKEEVRKQLTSELSQLEKLLEDGERPYLVNRKASVERALSTLDHGIERPFVSLMGITTPVTFDGLMNYDMATNGFIGRSLIFNEKETVPRAREGFKRPPLPERLANYVRAIWTGDSYDSEAGSRVENYDERVCVPTEKPATELLWTISRWMEDQAEEHKSLSGLEAIYLGAYEIVAKVSLILAIPEKLRTIEHVRWAFALVKRDLEDKVRLVVGNDSVKSSPRKAMQARILSLVSGGLGETEGVILNRLDRTFKRNEVEEELAAMTKRGDLRVEESTHPRNKKVSKRYFSASE